MYKTLLRTQHVKRVGRAARVCTFLFEILRVNRVLSVQIAAHWEQLHTLVCMSYAKEINFYDVINKRVRHRAKLGLGPLRFLEPAGIFGLLKPQAQSWQRTH